MTTHTDEERVRLLLAGAEHHERLAALIRPIVWLGRAEAADKPGRGEEAAG